MRLSKVDLPAFGGPRDRHHQTVAQPFATRGAGQRFGDLVAQALHNLQRRSDQVLRHIGLVGEIDARFDQRLRLDHPRAPGLGPFAEQAFELPIGLPALRLSFGADQIGKAFDGGEIEPAVLKGAARELACLRRPQALDATERAQRRGDHRTAAVQLQLGHILAGLAVRPGEP